MKNLILSVALLALVTAAYGQTEEFEFRDDFRPEYRNSLTIEQLAELQANRAVVILDVRLEEDFKLDPMLIPGAEHKNPEALPEWISQIDRTKEVVVYCVAGKWVSQKVAHILNQNGINVRSLEGGVEAWKAQQAGNKQNQTDAASDWTIEGTEQPDTGGRRDEDDEL